MSTKSSFWSRPRGPLLLGAAACAACCAAPLAAIVIGAGAASTVTAIMEPLAGLLLAAGAVLGIALLVRHRRARAAAACAVDGSCGCSPSGKRMLYSSPDPVEDAPIACTADLRNRDLVQAGIDSYRSAFTHLVATERTTNGFRWRFRQAPGLETKLQQLANAEHACCNFMKFEIAINGNEIVWETTAESRASEFIDEYMLRSSRIVIAETAAW